MSSFSSKRPPKITIPRGKLHTHIALYSDLQQCNRRVARLTEQLMEKEAIYENDLNSIFARSWGAVSSDGTRSHGTRSHGTRSRGTRGGKKRKLRRFVRRSGRPKMKKMRRTRRKN
jgi:hypothetical protein